MNAMNGKTLHLHPTRDGKTICLALANAFHAAAEAQLNQKVEVDSAKGATAVLCHDVLQAIGDVYLGQAVNS